MALNREARVVISAHNIRAASVLADRRPAGQRHLPAAAQHNHRVRPQCVVRGRPRRDPIMLAESSIWAVLTAALVRQAQLALCSVDAGVSTRCGPKNPGSKRDHPGDARAPKCRVRDLGAAPSCDGQRRQDHIALPASTARARSLVADRVERWSVVRLLPEANAVASLLLENLLEHTDSAPQIVVDTDGSAVTVAVSDSNTASATRHEASAGIDQTRHGTTRATAKRCTPS